MVNILLFSLYEYSARGLDKPMYMGMWIGVNWGKMVHKSINVECAVLVRFATA